MFKVSPFVLLAISINSYAQTPINDLAKAACELERQNIAKELREIFKLESWSEIGPTLTKLSTKADLAQVNLINEKMTAKASEEIINCLT